MALETETDVNRLTRVDDEDGDPQPPANTSQQRATNRRLGNHPDLYAADHTTSSTDAEPLPSSSVPDGVAVAVTASPDNSSTVWVGDETTQVLPLDPGESTALQVTNVDVIHVRAESSGDSVGILHEADT